MRGIGARKRTRKEVAFRQKWVQNGARKDERRWRPADHGTNGSSNTSGISGDGASLSIGLGQMSHATVEMSGALRHREQRRLGDDQGTVFRLGGCRDRVEKGGRESDGAIDPVFLRAFIGATFVARSF